MQKNYCIYLRKSRADIDAERHGEGETLKRHEEALLHYANTHKLAIVKIYREVVSGETIAARPQMQALLSDVENGLYSGVLVMESQRLARGDTIDQGIVARAFKQSNTLIITPMKTYDPNNEFDEEYFEFDLFMSRREYKTIARRLQRGRIASVQEGKFITGTAPYGYERIKIPNDKGYTLKPKKQEAQVVQMIYDLYVCGEQRSDGSFVRLGMTEICKRLDNLNIPPRRGKVWSKATILDILSNPAYIGQVRFQYYKESKSIIDGKLVKHKKKSSDYIQSEGLHAPIVSLETFNSAQRIKESRRKLTVPSKSTYRNPLMGLVYCKKCGTLMTRQNCTKLNYAFLTCPNRYCNNVSAALILVEKHVIESLKSWLPKYKMEFNIKDTQNEQTELHVIESSIKEASVELETLKKQKDNIFNLLEQGVYTPEIFTTRSSTLTTSINALESKLISYSDEKEKIMLRNKSKQEFIPKVESIISGYYNVESPMERNRLLKEVLEKVTYIKEKANTRGKSDNANFIIELFPKIPTV